MIPNDFQDFGTYNMIHKIAPFANPNEGMPYVVWNGAFSQEEINSMELIGDSIPSKNASVVVGIDNTKLDKKARISDVSWIDKNPKTEWIYSKISSYLRRINGEFYRFDVDGMYEQLQYTIYKGTESAFYNWHTDIGVYSSDSVTRKLSMSILISDPTSFEGGDLEIWGSTGPMIAPKQRGLPIVFPSYSLHRVTNVTKGIRKSIVVWFGGPAFK
jgi:PKHD-type hydroxylase